MTVSCRLTAPTLAAVLAGALAAAPATAAPTSPTDTRYVVTYYATPHKAQVVGVRWSGCGEPNGGWGGTSSHFTISHPPCP